MGNQSSSSAKSATRSGRRKLYAAAAASVVVIVLAASFIVAPPGETLDLFIDYTVGERMVYQVNETVVNGWVNASNPPPVTDTRSYVLALDVLNSTGEGFILNQTQASALALLEKGQPELRNVSKNPFYSVLLPPGVPLIFWNATSNPMLGLYLQEVSVRTSDVWTLPLNCANASFGLTGTVTVTFAGVKEVTTPSGTYKTVRIEITSSNLTINPDSTTTYQKGMTLQFNATTYLEQNTCRLIKTELSQETHLSASGTDNVATVHIEEALVQYTKP